MNKRIIIPIKEKIFRKEDIIRLSNFTFSEYKNSEGTHKEFTITIICENNEVYEFENNSIKKDEPILDIKKILEIQFNFIDYYSNKKINLQIKFTNKARK